MPYSKDSADGAMDANGDIAVTAPVFICLRFLDHHKFTPNAICH